MVCCHYRALSVVSYQHCRFLHMHPNSPTLSMLPQLVRNICVQRKSSSTVSISILRYLSQGFYLPSQSPVSLEVPVHGLLPLKSICRCLMSALQVPEHAPQLSQVVQAPSSNKGMRWRNDSIIQIHYLKSLTFTGSSFTWGSHAWCVTTIEHWTLPSIWVTGSRTGSPGSPYRPTSFNFWN